MTAQRPPRAWRGTLPAADAQNSRALPFSGASFVTFPFPRPFWYLLMLQVQILHFLQKFLLLWFCRG